MVIVKHSRKWRGLSSGSDIFKPKRPKDYVRGKSGITQKRKLPHSPVKVRKSIHPSPVFRGQRVLTKPHFKPFPRSYKRKLLIPPEKLEPIIRLPKPPEKPEPIIRLPVEPREPIAMKRLIR